MKNSSLNKTGKNINANNQEVDDESNIEDSDLDDSYEKLKLELKNYVPSEFERPKIFTYKPGKSKFEKFDHNTLDHEKKKERLKLICCNEELTKNY
jgi:hypothetical protein